MRSRISMLGLVAVVVLSAAVLPGIAEAASFADLKLVLSTDNAAPLPFEPAAVTVTLRNDTGGPIAGHDAFLTTGDYLRFMIRKDDGEFAECSLASKYGHRFLVAKPKVIEPGGSLARQHVLSYGWLSTEKGKGPGQHLFSSPGRYQFKAVLYDLDQKAHVESNVVEFQVSEPVKAADVAALEFIRKNAHRRNFLLQAPHGPRKEARETVAALKKLIQEHPNSRYTKYATHTLARSYKLRCGGTPDQAPALLAAVAEYPTFFLTGDALAGLIKYYAKRREFDKADGYLRRLEEVLPASDLVRTARHRVSVAKDIADKGE